MPAGLVFIRRLLRQEPLIAMGFRFRRSTRLGPLRFNFAKGGLSSISVGGRGASFNIPVARSGGTRTTVGAPQQTTPQTSGCSFDRRVSEGGALSHRHACPQVHRRLPPDHHGVTAMKVTYTPLSAEQPGEKIYLARPTLLF